MYTSISIYTKAKGGINPETQIGHYSCKFHLI